MIPQCEHEWDSELSSSGTISCKQCGVFRIKDADKFWDYSSKNQVKFPLPKVTILDKENKPSKT